MTPLLQNQAFREVARQQGYTIERLVMDVRRAVLADAYEAIRAVPSMAMDTLVPNTGPDVIGRGDALAAIRETLGS